MEETVVKTKKKKKKSFIGVFFTVILWILIVIIVAAAAFLLYLKSNMKKAELYLEDYKALAAAEPMTADERFEISSEGEVAMKLDNRDIWWWADKYYGADIEYAREQAAAYGIDLTGLGISISAEDGIRADVEAYYKSIRLAASLYADWEYKNGTLTLTPSAVEIAGFTIPLSLAREYAAKYFDTDFSEEDLAVEISPEVKLLEGDYDLRPAEDAFVFTGHLPSEPFEHLAFLSGRELSRGCYLLDSFKYALPVIMASENDEDPAARAAEILLADPGLYPEYITELLSLTEMDYIYSLELNECNYGFNSRWLPEAGSIRNCTTDFRNEFAPLSEDLSRNQKALGDAYSSGRISIENNCFMLDGEPLTFTALLPDGSHANGRLTDDSGSFLCLIDRSGISDRDAPAILEMKITDSDLSSFEPAKKYPIGIVSENSLGMPFVLYRSTSNTVAQGVVVPTVSYTVTMISEEEYEEIKACGGIPVWR